MVEKKRPVRAHCFDLGPGEVHRRQLPPFSKQARRLRIRRHGVAPPTAVAYYEDVDVASFIHITASRRSVDPNGRAFSQRHRVIRRKRIVMKRPIATRPTTTSLAAIKRDEVLVRATFDSPVRFVALSMLSRT